MSLDLGETILQLDRVHPQPGAGLPGPAKPVGPTAAGRRGGYPGGGPPQDRAVL